MHIYILYTKHKLLCVKYYCECTDCKTILCIFLEIDRGQSSAIRNGTAYADSGTKRQRWFVAGKQSGGEKAQRVNWRTRQYGSKKHAL